ncbi:hypothetical protein [Ferrimonas balearica]|nr:hypothetical protein [Ferrimonas balearica]MBY5994147.1 hypothetical protein [Ferrimonas balearica]
MIAIATERRKGERRDPIDRRQFQRYGLQGQDRRHRLGRRASDQAPPIL